MDTPRDFIEDIANRHVSSDKEFTLDSLTGAIDRLEKAFPRYESFLMEFVQNADDARSQSLKVEVLEDSIVVANDGLPFSKEDVTSICKVGRSSKTAKDYIGYLGVGFKSVFLISEGPEIYSGGYEFRFDKGAWADPKHMPWQIIPVWIDTPKLDLSQYSEYTTVFNLPVVPGSMERLKGELASEHLNSRLLLFLRHIKRIEITDATAGLRRRIVTSKLSRKSGYEIHQTLEEYDDGETLQSRDLWLVFRSTRSVPEHVREDYVTIDWGRQDVERREVLAAFRLDGERNLVREEEGTAHIGVFSFLPLKEIESGLSFLLQADFLTAPGRGVLARDCLWNEWLADEICSLIVGQCTPTFLDDDSWKMNFTDVLYSAEGGHELFDERLKDPINRHLQEGAVLIAEDGTPSKAEELLLVGAEIRGLLADDDIGSLSPGKRALHGRCTPHPRLEVELVPEDLREFIASSHGERLIRSRAQRRRENVEWFLKLYSAFMERYDRAHFFQYHHYNVKHDRFWNRMRDLDTPIILTNKYRTARIDEAYVRPKQMRKPSELRDRLEIVHPQIAKDERFHEFRRKLNEERHYLPAPREQVLRELTEEDIKDALRQRETANIEWMTRNWKTLSDSERIKRIRRIKNLSDTSPLALEDYDFLTVKTKDGKWAKPQKVLFPREYEPDHDIEGLVADGLLDLPVHFLSADFIEYSYQIAGWHEFFEALGVDMLAEPKKEGGKMQEIVERIGVLTALRYEKEHDRAARELGESTRLGYDIESHTDTETRHVEVKATSHTSFDVFLTANEYAALRANERTYYIYVVSNALWEPVLDVVRGDKVLESGRIKISIPSAELETLKSDRYRP